MVKIEMFFDYACPFCLSGYNDLIELLPNYPDIEMVWHFCEARPRPEEGYGKHSDLCIQGMFFAAQSGVDLMLYHKKMFTLYHEDKIDVEDIDVLADSLGSLLDADGLRHALKSGKYAQNLHDANAYAYKESGVWVIPDFRMDSHRLVASAGVGITKKQLEDFLNLSRC
ncbi:MAG: DsbA family protein [Defluviitaleaceae bacterium]|nr:DsbA family protein [Defluviitaleaceae bacterium]